MMEDMDDIVVGVVTRLRDDEAGSLLASVS